MCAKKLQEGIVKVLLTNTPIWAFLLAIIGIVLFLTFVLFQGGFIKIGKFEMSRLDYRKMDKIIELNNEKSRIQIVEGLQRKEQRLAMEEALNTMIVRFLDFHRELIEKKGFEDQSILTCPQYLHYQSIVDNAMEVMRIKVLIECQDMSEQFGIDDKNSVRWETHRSSLAEYYIAEFGKVIQARWVNLGISVDENYEATRELVPYVFTAITEMFDTLLDIQIKYMERTKSIDEELESIFNGD